MFYVNVRDLINSTSFPSQSTEALGYFASILESSGNQLASKALTTETHRLLSVSELRSTKSAPFLNKRAEQDLWEQLDQDKSTPQLAKGRLLADGSVVDFDWWGP